VCNFIDHRAYRGIRQLDHAHSSFEDNAVPTTALRREFIDRPDSKARDVARSNFPRTLGLKIYQQKTTLVEENRNVYVCLLKQSTFLDDNVQTLAVDLLRMFA
jgi:hypothetical protein